jgi:branched-chain amino acid transport system substrate-binding protein
VPSVVATLSSVGLTQVTRLFRDRLIGFTSVVPNPEVSQLPLVRELERDADAFVGPEAFTFEGLAAYLHLRVCAEALRRTRGRVDGPHLIEAFEGLGALNLGGFRLRQ